MRGGPQEAEFIYKKWCNYSYMFNFRHLRRTLHLMQYTYWDVFSTAQNSVWTRRFWCLLVLLLIFVSPLPHWQNVSLWGFFSFREITKKRCLRGKTRWIGRVGPRGHAIFGQKLLNTQHRVGRCTCKSPVMKWANVLKESSKILTEAKRSLSQQCQLVHWFRWVSRTLT